MRKIAILIIISLISFNGYCFWIWSPKTKKWKNPKYSALVTPYLQYREAQKYFDTKRYKVALTKFKKLIVNYPDAFEAAESQFFIGRCLQELNQPYQAFLEFKKVLISYPNSQRINEVIERQYRIGEYFLGREPKRWLGVSMYDFVEHPAIEIFKTIVDKVPYSEYAPVSQYKLGVLLMDLVRFQESREAFQKVIDDYPDSEWALPSRYQLAVATAKAFPGGGYDSSALEEATRRLDEFIKKHPEAKVVSAATDKLAELRNKEAKKKFDIAKFYEKQKKYKSAVVYYKTVLDEYPDSDYVSEARGKIEELRKYEE
ncbi:MAG: outer membrane protein assembly factor BamD [Candidatus Omnitrophota bacterium]|nr:MAG: outer membrane protein assembly factor BamD [Candidatus Omnitrophota bacterium]